MDGDKLRLQIGTNIGELRRKTGMTQAELADKLNYSDKAVSKWERGESMPDVVTLLQLSKTFGVSVDALLGNTTPELPEKPEKKRSVATYKGVLRLSSLLVWFVALLVYVILSSVGLKDTWMAFVYAVPVNAIVLLALRSAWRDYQYNMIYISLIVWGSLAAIYVTMLVFAHVNVWKLIFLAIIGQAAICLWFRMLRKQKDE